MTRPRRTPTIALRLGLAFAAILGLFAVALLVTLAALDRIAGAEAEVAALDHAKHAGHMAAAQVREQYIHQAHSLIHWDTSHLAHYDDAVRATSAATAHLRELAATPDERRRAEEIARLARESDEAFRSTVVPAIRAGAKGRAPDVGDRIEAVVGRVVALNEELNGMFERRSAAARARAEALRGQARTATLVCFGLAIALAAAVGVLLTRAILKPVGALREGARRVGAGDLAARIVVPDRNEFGELADTFNQMTADLARHQEALVRSQKLASIGHIAAGVAHEINNPLSVILGYAKLLRRKDGAGEEPGIIEEEAVQCQRIVSGLLDLARPQRLDLGDVDLADLARDALRRLEESGQLAGRRALPPAAGVRAVARGDEAKLRQVIANVLCNAAEATPEGGAIRVEARSAGGEAVLVVEDDGPGIPADALPRIFDPFFTTKPRGTGLGLAIVQAIVDAHGGRIEVVPAPAHGTRVALHLPAAA